MIIHLYLRHNKYIESLKHLENDIGKEKLLEMLKRSRYEENVKLGKRLFVRIPSPKAFANPFRDVNSSLSKTIVREIVEDSDTSRNTLYARRRKSCLKTI